MAPVKSPRPPTAAAPRSPPLIRLSVPVFPVEIPGIIPKILWSVLGLFELDPELELDPLLLLEPELELELEPPKLTPWACIEPARNKTAAQ